MYIPVSHSFKDCELFTKTKTLVNKGEKNNAKNKEQLQKNVMLKTRNILKDVYIPKNQKKSENKNVD